MTATTTGGRTTATPGAYPGRASGRATVPLMTAAEYLNAAAHHQRAAEEELKRKAPVPGVRVEFNTRASAHAALATSYLLSAQIELGLRPPGRQTP